MVADSDDDMLRLVTVIEHQQRELDRIRAAAAGESLVAMARGALMERLGLSSARAASQLAELPGATGIPPAEMAAGVLSDSGEAGVAGPGAAPARAAAGSAGSVVAAQVRRDGSPRSRSLMTEAAAEMAADGTELVAMLAAQLAPLGAVTVTLWLLQADGALALLGDTGLAIGEASRWQHIPPQFDCPAQRVAHGAADQIGRASCRGRL